MEERQWPRMDPPNVLWFFGAIVMASAVNLLLATFPESHNGLWIFLGAFAFLLVFIALSLLLLGVLWWVPAGLAAALAVSLVPGTTIGLLKLVTLWPDDPFYSPFSDFSWWAFFVAFVSVVAGIVAFERTRFAFILAEVAVAVLIAAQLLTPVFSSSSNAHAWMAIVSGTALVAFGVFLDSRGQRREAFWFHVLGFFSVAAALVYWASISGGNHQRGWIPMLIAGVAVMLAAGPLRRATWAVYGVLGYFVPVVRYMVTGLDEESWPFALWLMLLALSIFLVGIALANASLRLTRRPSA